MGNINQYKFAALPNSKIIITEEIYKRLLSLTNFSSLRREEHMCFLFGKEVRTNVIFFDEMNDAQDYEIFGSGSNNPLEHGVGPGRGKLAEELKARIDGNQDSKTVICDIHTHPSGIADGIEYRFFSGADLDSNKKFTHGMNERNITHIAGLIASDNKNGNSTISFIWYDELNNKFYRIPNISVAKYYEREKKWKCITLPSHQELEFLETGFNSIKFPEDSGNHENR